METSKIDPALVWQVFEISSGEQSFTGCCVFSAGTVEENRQLFLISRQTRMSYP
jgi:hypothetical protein